jgi:hypothetical protein
MRRLSILLLALLFHAHPLARQVDAAPRSACR